MTFVVERIGDRLVTGGGRLYLLKASQALGLRVGDRITVLVRKVERADIGSVLSAADVRLVTDNPLYKESASSASSGSNPLFVAE
ncbi:MAG: hypothetical protein O3B04_09825 [Chloroflexi bacterium]|nr:hypothetical protein [Chloroflexota bacterium]